MKNKMIKLLIICLIIIFIVVCLINLIMISKTSNYIDKDIDYNSYSYLLVLGAGIKNNYPSLMLKDRLDKALEIYNINNNIKIILSGDSIKEEEYDETIVMYNYLIERNVNKDNIIIDKKGISTYNSIKNIISLVGNNKLIIVTQKYHLTRSIYIAINNNIDAYGISSYNYKYIYQFKRDIREILARVKDYIYVLINKEV